jgi:hypothetical protein
MRSASFIVACLASTIIIITKRFEKMVDALVLIMFAWNLARTPETVATIPGRSFPTAVRTSLLSASVIEGNLQAQLVAQIFELLPEFLQTLNRVGDIDKKREDEYPMHHNLVHILNVEVEIGYD